MGNEKKEGVVEQLEDMLGLGKETPVDTKEEKPSSTPPADDKKEENVTATATPNTTVVTDEQVLITKDIAKIDLQIESLEAKSVDVDKFYDNIDEHLTEEEQALEHSDRPAYMKLINTKVQEYETQNSSADEILKLKDEKKEKESIYERQSAITEVIAKYPSYNHEDVLAFFENDLSKAQQQKIYDDSKSYADVYENAYNKFLQSNPANIETQTPPNIPNVNNSRKQPLKNNDIEESLQSEDDKIQEALGL